MILQSLPFRRTPTDRTNAQEYDERTWQVDAYFSHVLGSPVRDGESIGLHICETTRRQAREEGYGQVWPIFMLRKGTRWWLSAAPDLVETVRPVVAAAFTAGDFGIGLGGKVRQILGGKVAIQNAHHSHLYIPADMPNSPSVPEGYSLQQVILEGKPANIPVESVATGTALAIYTSATGELASWAEATPLATVTQRYGVMLVGIETVERHRRRGLAKAVLAALTRRVISLGNVPLYFCAATNTASQRTAQACGYRLY